MNFRSDSCKKKFFSGFLKLATALAMLFITCVSAYSQDIKIKGKKVLLNKQEVLEVNGSASVFNGVDLTFTSLGEGEVLFRLKQVNLRYENPFFPVLYWHELSFPSSGNMARIYIDEPYYSKKKVVELLMNNTSWKLIDTEMSFPEIEKWVMEKKDQSEKVLKDSLIIANTRESISETLKSQKNVHSPRPKIDIVTLEYYPPSLPASFRGFVVERKYMITENEKAIGRVDIEIERIPGNELKKAWRYVFYKKIDKPFDIPGQKDDFLICSTFKISDPNTTERTPFNTYIHTYEDHMNHPFNQPNTVKIDNFTAAQYPITLFLVENGYL